MGVESIGTYSFNNATHVLSVSSIKYWYNGVSYTSPGAVTADIDQYYTIAENTTYYFQFNSANGTLQVRNSFWDLKTAAPVATVFWNGVGGSIQDEDHSYTRNIDWHINAHLTIGARYYSGFDLTNPTTVNDGILNISAGTFYDEDLAFAGTRSQGNARAIYKVTPSVYTMNDISLPYTGTLGSPTYLNTNTYVLTTLGGANRFANYWVYAAHDNGRNIYIYPTHSTTTYTTITNARSELPPTLSGLNLNNDYKLLWRFTYSGDGQFQEAVDYRTSSVLPGGGTTATSASAVIFVPYGQITSATVQGALEQLEDNKATKSSLNKTNNTANAAFKNYQNITNLQTNVTRLWNENRTIWGILNESVQNNTNQQVSINEATTNISLLVAENRTIWTSINESVVNDTAQNLSIEQRVSLSLVYKNITDALRHYLNITNLQTNVSRLWNENTSVYTYLNNLTNNDTTINQRITNLNSSTNATIEARLTTSNMWNRSTNYIYPYDLSNNVSIGTEFNKNKLDVEGGVAIGTTYAGNVEASSNGLIVEGFVGIGTAVPNQRLQVTGRVNATEFIINKTRVNEYITNLFNSLMEATTNISLLVAENRTIWTSTNESVYNITALQNENRTIWGVLNESVANNTNQQTSINEATTNISLLVAENRTIWTSINESVYNITALQNENRTIWGVLNESVANNTLQQTSINEATTNISTLQTSMAEATTNLTFKANKTAISGLANYLGIFNGTRNLNYTANLQYLFATKHLITKKLNSSEFNATNITSPSEYGNKNFYPTAGGGLTVTVPTASTGRIGFNGVILNTNPIIYSNGGYLVLEPTDGDTLHLGFDNTNTASTVNMFNGKFTVNKGGATTVTGTLSVSAGSTLQELNATNITLPNFKFKDDASYLILRTANDASYGNIQLQNANINGNILGGGNRITGFTSAVFTELNSTNLTTGRLIPNTIYLGNSTQDKLNMSYINQTREYLFINTNYTYINASTVTESNTTELITNGTGASNDIGSTANFDYENFQMFNVTTIATSTYNITQIRFYVNRVGTGSGINVSIIPTRTGGLPISGASQYSFKNILGYEANLSAGGAGSALKRYANFSTSKPLNKSQAYYIVWRRTDTVSGTNYYQLVRNSATDDYTKGLAYKNGTGTAGGYAAQNYDFQSIIQLSTSSGIAATFNQGYVKLSNKIKAKAFVTGTYLYKENALNDIKAPTDYLTLNKKTGKTEIDHSKYGSCYDAQADGINIDCETSLIKGAVYELKEKDKVTQQTIKTLQGTIDSLQVELCKQNPTYNFCLTGNTAKLLQQDSIMALNGTLI